MSILLFWCNSCFICWLGASLLLLKVKICFLLLNKNFYSRFVCWLNLFQAGISFASVESFFQFCFFLIHVAYVWSCRVSLVALLDLSLSLSILTPIFMAFSSQSSPRLLHLSTFLNKRCKQNGGCNHFYVNWHYCRFNRSCCGDFLIRRMATNVTHVRLCAVWLRCGFWKNQEFKVFQFRNTFFLNPLELRTLLTSAHAFFLGFLFLLFSVFFNK